MQLRIDPELESLIPPLSPSEFEQLEQSVLDEGFRDNLITWNGTLVDGHNRYRIAQKHGLEFEITEKEFETKEDVKDWMYKNQLGRRNLTPEMRDYCIGQLYRSAKRKKGSNNQYVQVRKSEKAQNEPFQRTAEIVAEQYGVGKETVKRSEKFADGVDRIGEIAPEIKQDILKGKTSVTKTEIRELAKASDEEVAAAVDGIRNPKPKSDIKTESAKPLSPQLAMVAEFYDKMKNPPPMSGSGNNSLSDDPIITEMTETIKSFRNAMNKFLFIEEKTDKALKDLITETIEELTEINLNIKEQ